MTQPMFSITSRTDSGIDLPDLSLTDEKLISKFGSELGANFADIRTHGAKAFFQKENRSNGVKYSLCACATGYIWVYVSAPEDQSYSCHTSNVQVQIGTFSLKNKAITTVEVPCRYSYGTRQSQTDSPLTGRLALLCANVMARYLQLRIMGRQYEEAAETAIRELRKDIWSFKAVDRGSSSEFEKFLQQICANAPLPPISDVSLISRGMITGRWQRWMKSKVLRRRCFFPQKVIRCLKGTQHDSLDLLSGAFLSFAAGKAPPA